MDGVDQELWVVFRDEAVENLEAFTLALDALEHEASAEHPKHLHKALRVLHNIKGSARLVGVLAIESTAHAMEDALIPLRERSEIPSEPLLLKMREGVGLMARILGGEPLDESVSQYVRELSGAHAKTKAAEAPLPSPSKPQVVEAPAPPPPKAHAPEAPQEPPATTDAAAVARPISAEATRVREELGQPARRPLPETPKARELPQTAEAASTVRIEASRLDRMMHFTGEFMMAQSRFGARHSELEGHLETLRQGLRELGGHAPDVMREVERALSEVISQNRKDVQRFTYLVSDWSASIKRARMLPLSSVVSHWRRTVSETAHSVSRDVRLVGETGDIEIDRQILDNLRDPLMHLLRNAVDHGIEPADERIEKGKLAAGTIVVRARALGTMVEIEVSDDGRGLDPVRVGEKAVEKGLITRERLATMAPQDVLEFVFAPGFSTSASVNRVSGRGMGLDIVRRRLSSLGGQARICTPTLSGTTFRLEVPATVVSTRGLLVHTPSAAYVLPNAYVLRTLRVEATDVRTVDGKATILVKSEPLRLRWLQNLMKEPRKADPPRLLIVIVSDGVTDFGLVVNEIVGEVEFVAKELPWNVPRPKGVAGAMVLGNGGVAIVVDVPRLAGENGEHASERDDVVHLPEKPKQKRVLVVDDSLTSRTLERNILVTAGYQVQTSIDGEEAFQLLEAEPFDLVVSDIEMPKLNGLELTRRIRAHPRFKNLPVILVTSLDSPGDVAQGSAAGADEYVVKGRFDQRKLLEAVARLV